MLLYFILILPFVAAIVVALGSRRDEAAATRTAMFVAVVNALLSLGLLSDAYLGYQTALTTWFRLPGTDASVTWQLANDGLSAWLIILVAWLTPAALLGARRELGQRMREYGALIHVLSGAMIGALLVTDLVTFYMFYEAMLIPMLILIGAFGDEHRRASALQFFIYTMLSSVGMLVAIWYIANATASTNITEVVGQIAQMNPDTVMWLFWAFALAFAVKVPLLPLHTWQAAAYASAPAGVGVLLGGVMAKVGIYGFLRIVLPLFPAQVEQHAVLFIILGGVGAIVGSLLAIAQTDLKRILAFSSLGHLGLVVAAIFTRNETALTGAAVQLVAHGLAVGALFLVVAHLEATTGKRGLNQFGGLAQSAPGLAVLCVAATMISVALPGTLAFVGEFQMLYGLYESSLTNLFWVAVITLSVVFGAVYALRIIQQVFYGPAMDNGTQGKQVAQASGGIVGAAGFLVVVAVILGFYPAPVSAPLQQAVAPLAISESVSSAEMSARPDNSAVPLLAQQAAEGDAP